MCRRQSFVDVSFGTLPFEVPAVLFAKFGCLDMGAGRFVNHCPHVCLDRLVRPYVDKKMVVFRFVANLWHSSDAKRGSPFERIGAMGGQSHFMARYFCHELCARHGVCRKKRNS